LYVWRIKLNRGKVEKIVECSFIPISNRRGEVVGFSGMLRDITSGKNEKNN
jgi:hypothetical protein